MEVRSGKPTGGFLISNSKILNQIMVPRYYDPDIRGMLDGLSKTHDLITIGELVEKDQSLKFGRARKSENWNTGLGQYRLSEPLT